MQSALWLTFCLYELGVKPETEEILVTSDNLEEYRKKTLEALLELLFFPEFYYRTTVNSRIPVQDAE